MSVLLLFQPIAATAPVHDTELGRAKIAAEIAQLRAVALEAELRAERLSAELAMLRSRSGDRRLQSEHGGDGGDGLGAAIGEYAAALGVNGVQSPTAPPSPPSPPPSPPPPAPPPSPPGFCSNECTLANDGKCDEVEWGVVARAGKCPFGTDCADCESHEVCYSCPDACRAVSILALEADGDDSESACLETAWEGDMCSSGCNIYECGHQAGMCAGVGSKPLQPQRP